jgi:hypothetical protein
MGVILTEFLYHALAVCSRVHSKDIHPFSSSLLSVITLVVVAVNC